MATYKTIKGFTVQKLSSDPSNLLVGSAWYNSTTGKLKVGVSQETWATGGVLTTARKGIAGFGQAIPTAVAAAGSSVPGNANQTATEKYDGTSWTNSGNLNTARGWIGHGQGTQTAGLVAGGWIEPPGVTTSSEEFDGSTWTASPGNINTGREWPGAAGTQTAGMIVGGDYPSAPGAVKNTEEYNGSTWSANPAPSGVLPIGKTQAGSAGTQTAALLMGGNGDPGTPGTSTQVLEYNGTTWSISPVALPTGFVKGGSSQAGTQTSALIFGGGSHPGSTTSFKYDGTAWTATPSMNANFTENGSCGTQASAMAFGGEPPSTGTDEFTITTVAEAMTTS